jgi:hypothetical protein
MYYSDAHGHRMSPSGRLDTQKKVEAGFGFRKMRKWFMI